MTTDTKALARWNSWGGEIDIQESDTGQFVLFTDHERVVGELAHLNFVKAEVIRDFVSDIETLRTALAASRAEVEGLRVELLLILGWATTEKKPLRAQEIESIRRKLEKGNV